MSRRTTSCAVIAGALLGACSPATAFADPAWAPALSLGALASPLSDHAALPIPGGRVLVVGGTSDGTSATAFAAVYDPTLPDWPLGGWASVPSMAAARRGATATAIGTKVLVAGGQAGADLASAEIFDTSAGAWAAAAPLLVARSAHAAVAFSGPTAVGASPVVVTGGSSGGASLASVEAYDTQASTWSLAGPMTVPRSGHTATAVGPSRMLVAGGGAASSETFDLLAGTWSPPAVMSAARSAHTATELLDHRVLVAGGAVAGAAVASAEIYDPGTGVWSSAASMAQAREGHTATLLADGTVLVAGGDDGASPLASAERYDPAAQAWYPAATMTTSRSHAAAVLLADGAVLVSGGTDGAQVLPSSDVFAPQPLGAGCTARGECQSLHCAGTCCATECQSFDPCYVSYCGGDGTCTTTVACDGTPCPPPNRCAPSATCWSGVCQADSLQVCPAPDACNDGVCDPATGACVSAPRADGTLCDDHDACTVGETCRAGACAGGAAMVCQAEDACHGAGTCDPQAGCDNPVLASCGGTVMTSGPPGATLDGEICGADGECQSGHCSRGVCCDSACTDQCHSCALPESRGVCTVEPEGTDLYQQCGFVGTCERTCGAGGTCVGATAGTTCVPERCVDQHHASGAVLCEPLAGGGFQCPAPSSSPVDCAPYACLAPFGACATTCRTVADCAPGYACAGDYRCQLAPSPTSGSDGGCQHPSGSPSGPGAASLLLLLALLRRHAGSLGKRRRRIS